MPEAEVRAAPFARIAGMAQGGSGVSIAVYRALVDALNRGVYACVPAWGSISVADMPPLARLALVLIGEGEAFVAGRRVVVRRVSRQRVAARPARPGSARGAGASAGGSTTPGIACAKRCLRAGCRAPRAGPAVVSLRGAGARRRARRSLARGPARRNRAQRPGRQPARRRGDRRDILDRQFSHSRACDRPRGAGTIHRSGGGDARAALHPTARAGGVGLAAAANAPQPAAIGLCDRRACSAISAPPRFA